MRSVSTIVDEITLILLSADEQPLFRSLRQFFLYDLSQIHTLDPNEQGYFDIAALYAAPEPSQDRTFLIRRGALAVGYAIVQRHSRLQPLFDGHTIAELFVLRRHRNSGIGRAAAERLFCMFPGEWELSAPAANVPGHTFCRAVVDRFTAGKYRETWHQNGTWRGPVQRFTVG